MQFDEPAVPKLMSIRCNPGYMEPQCIQQIATSQVA